jgi:integrase
MSTFGYTSLAVRETPTQGYPKPRLLDRVRDAIRVRHYSRRTEKTYVAWIKRYIFFHGKRHPVEMGAPEVTRFLTWLATDGKVAASTQNQALNALLFLYRVVLEQELPWLDEVVRARRPEHLPVVLTRDEVRTVLERLDGTPRLMAVLLYGAGLRLLECAHLRVKDIDFTTNQIVIRSGKGAKDRVTMLPTAVKPGLLRHVESMRRQHEEDVRRGAGWVEMPDAPGAEVPQRRPDVGLAVGLPRHAPLHRPRHRPAPPPSLARIGPAARGQARPADRRHHQARQLPHVPSLVRDASSRGRSRYSDSPGTIGTSRRGDHDDIHPRAEPRASGRSQPRRSAARAVTLRRAIQRALAAYPGNAGNAHAR